MNLLNPKHLPVSFVLATTLISIETTRPVFAQTNPTPSSVSQDTKTKLFEVLKKNTTTVTFSQGGTALTESERDTLIATVNAAKNVGTIARVIIAAWSDKEYPAAKGASLDNKDIGVAKARITSIKQVLESLDIKEIETYTMTENPSWFGRLFNTAETKIKGAGKPNSQDDQMIEELGKTIRERGGPGKAVVFIRHSGEGLTH
jgi:hypothetical protein